MVASTHHFHGDECLCGFKSARSRSRTEHIMLHTLAVAQPEVNSYDPRELKRRGWTCGCEPGDYDECDDCLSAAHELANFLNRPEVPGA